MRYRLSMAAALALLSASMIACDGTRETTSDGNGGDGGGGAAPFTIDPAEFDCSAKKPPARVNPVPVGCAIDRSCTIPLVSGHRGVGGELGVIAPEDTLAAVRAAIVLGLDFVETDPRPTKDGYLVNLHDPEVDRTTLGTGKVEELTLQEIQALTLRTEEFPGDFSCEAVPTLEQILEAAKDKIAVLVDANKTDRVDLLVSAIQKTGTLEWAIFDTESVAKIDEALALEPGLLTMIRVGSKDELAEALVHLQEHPPVIVEIHDGASPLVLVPEIHDAKHRALVNVFVQDVSAALDDDAEAYDQTIANGVDILQTDRPELLLPALHRWPPPAQP